MKTPINTHPNIDYHESGDAKGPYGGDPYFRGPFMNPLAYYSPKQPIIKKVIYVSGQENIKRPESIEFQTSIFMIVFIFFIIILAALVFLKNGYPFF